MIRQRARCEPSCRSGCWTRWWQRRTGHGRARRIGSRTLMVTIKEVAARARVSPSTVSNVFLGRVPVTEATKRRVLSAAQRLGYQPDGLAQALRTGRTHTLGLLVPHITKTTIDAIVSGETRDAQEAGYAV